MAFFDRMFGASSQEHPREAFLPPDSRQLLIRYAKQGIVPGHEDAEAYSRVNYLSAHMYMRAESNPDELYAELTGVVEGQADWVSAGAAWFIKDLGLPGYQSNAAAWALMDLATRFLRRRNIPFSVLAPIQADWWRHNYPNEQWLTYPPLPDKSSHPIADLAPGEERAIVRMGPIGNNNTIVMRREEDGAYAAYIDSPSGDASGQMVRSDWAWFTNVDRYNLAVHVTNTLNYTPPWVSPDLVPYMLPAPDYS